MTTAPARPTAPEAVDWHFCASCRDMVYLPRLERNLGVCPECGHHGRLDATTRIAQLFDPGPTVLTGVATRTHDPLGFVDTQPYPQRLARARAGSGLDEAVVCVAGSVEGQPLVAAVMDFRFLGGSLGSGVGERIVRAAEEALERRCPLLIVSASGGARMQEGAVALMQMAKTAQALGQLDEAGLLTVSLVTDPTFGGVAASFATLCDVIVAEPGARLGFAGRRVIEQTIRERLPEDFQTAEYLLAQGFIDAIRPRRELRGLLARLLRTAAARPAGTTRLATGEAPAVVTDPQRLPAREPWAAVRRARDIDRPTTLDYVSLLCTDFVQLAGDRVGGECRAIVAGLGRLRGAGVAVIGHQKGHTPAELAAHNFGMPTPAGYRKAARVMRLAAKLGLPVVTLVDTPGAYPGLEAERSGQAVAIAENLRLMAGLPVPTVAVVTGEGGSGGALALAVTDRVLCHSDAVYSVISPEGCASILWKDASAAPTAATALRVDSTSLLRLGIVDGVIPEPEAGVAGDPLAAAGLLGEAVCAALDELREHPGTELVARRRDRFRRFGADDDTRRVEP